MLLLFGGHSFEDNSDHNITQVLDTEKLTWTEFEFKAFKILYFCCNIVNIPQVFMEPS